MPGIVKIAFLGDVGPAKLSVQEFASSVDDSVGKVGKSWGRVKDILKVGALAGAAAIGAGLLEGMDVDAARDKLAAQLGLTGADAEKIGDAAGTLYKNGFGDSIEGAGEIVKLAFQNGLVGINDSADAIQGVSEQIANYATLSGEDALSATEAVSQMLRNKLAPNADYAFDILTKGQQLGINKSEDLLDTFNEYGTQFRKLGLSADDALGLMNQLIRSGARDSDTAADAIKEFSIRAIDGSKTSAAGFKALGLDASKMATEIGKGGPAARTAFGDILDGLNGITDPVKREQAGVALFGTKWEDLGGAIKGADLDTAAQSLGKVGGAAKSAGDTLNDNAKARVVSFGRTLKTNIVTFIGKEVIPKLDELGQAFQDDLAPKLSDLADRVVPRVRTAIDGLQQFWTDNKEEIKLFADNAGELAGKLDEKLSPALERVVPLLGKVAEIDLSRSISSLEAFNRLLSGKQEDGSKNSIVDKIRDAGEVANQVNLGGRLSGIASDAISQFVNKFKTDKSFRPAVGAWFADVGKTIVQSQGVVQVTSFAAGTGIGKKIVDGLAGTSGSAKTRTFSFMSNLGKYLSFSNPTGVANNAGAFLGRRIVDGLAGTSGSAKTRAVTFMGNLGSFVSAANPLNLARTVGAKLGFDLVGAITSGGGKALGGVKKFIGGIPSALAAAGGDWGGVLVNAGREIIGGLISGIQGKLGDLRSKLAEVTNLIPGWKGPLDRDKRLLTPAGQAIMGSLIRGIDDQLPELRRQLGSVSDLIEGGLTASPAVTLAAASVAPAAFATPTGAGGLTINVYALTDGPEVGRRVTDAIRDYEAINGTSWRNR